MTLYGELLADRLYEIFGPISLKIAGINDSDMTRQLQRNGIRIVEDDVRQEAVLFTKVVHRSRASSILAIEGFRYIALYVDPVCGLSRAELDESCFERGLRKSPLNAEAVPSETRDLYEAWWAIYERAPKDCDDGFLTRSGRDADAVMAHYAYAASAVRPGDNVLVVSTDSDGAHFLSTVTSAQKVLTCSGTDGDDGDRNIDVIIDVENTPSDSVKSLQGQLVPAGIVLTTRKALWSHGDLMPSNTVWQNAGVVNGRNRSFAEALGEVELTTLRKPYLVENARYENRADVFRSQPGIGIDFARYYVFPDIVRAIVSKQFRVQDIDLLTDECRQLLDSVTLLAADAGAALCVLSYCSTDLQFAIDDARVLTYLSSKAFNPHVIRWQISLAFVRGDAFLNAGKPKLALEAYEQCLGFDASLFHPSILTKQVGACLKAATITTAAGDFDQAAEYLRQGTVLGRHVTGADSDHLFGRADDPRYFYFGEMAEVMTLSSRCAYALEQWRRGGGDRLREALGRSVDLFRQPRHADIRDLRLQSDIISMQEQWLASAGHKPTKELFQEFSETQLSIKAFLSLALNVIATKARTIMRRRKWWSA